MFFKFRQRRTRLDLVLTVLARDPSVPKKCAPVARRFSLCFILNLRLGDFVLRRLRGGSPKQFQKKAPAAGAVQPIIAVAARPSAISFCLRASPKFSKASRRAPTSHGRGRVGFCTGILLQRASWRFRVASIGWRVAEKKLPRAPAISCPPVVPALAFCIQLEVPEAN